MAIWTYTSNKSPTDQTKSIIVRKDLFGNPSLVLPLGGSADLDDDEVYKLQQNFNLSPGLNVTAQETFPANTPAYSVSLVEAYGYSHVLSFGLNSYKYRWTARLASALGAVEANRAKGGSFVTSGDKDQMQYQVKQLTPRNRTTSPYTPTDSDLIFLAPGITEPAFVGPSCWVAIQEGVRSIIGYMKSGALFQALPGGASHPSISYGGTWYDVASTTAGNTGNGYRATLTNGSTFTITVPSDFPGGDIYIGTCVQPFGSVSTVTLNVTGATTKSQVESTTSYHSVNSKSNGGLIRITELNPGAHSILGTISGVSVFGFCLDYWSIPSDPAPRFCLLRQSKLTAAGRSFTFGSISSYNDAQADYLNNLLSETASQWTDGSVEFVDYNTNVEQREKYLNQFDHVHHNELGEAKLAENLLNYFSASERSAKQSSNRSVGFPGIANITSYSNNWVDATTASGYQTGSVILRKDYTVKLTGKVKKNSGSPSMGETIATIAPYSRPSLRHSFICSATPGRTAILEMRPDGNLIYADGSVTTGGSIDLDNVEYTINS